MNIEEKKRFAIMFGWCRE
jgi:hypothetical protein